MSVSDSPQQILAKAFLKALDIEQNEDVVQSRMLTSNLSPRSLALAGLAAINLNPTSVRTTLGGKTVFDFTPDSAYHSDDGTFSCAGIRVGDIVAIKEMPSKSTSTNSKKKNSDVIKEDKEEITGVVNKISSKGINVALDNSEEKSSNSLDSILSSNKPYYIVKATNSATYNKMKQTMRKLSELKSLGSIASILLGETSLSSLSIKNSYNLLEFFDKNLNDSQKQAIDFSLNGPSVSIIHGPPGTGKTHTLVELILHLVFNCNERVLVCGPSNISVDTILERLNVAFKAHSISSLSTADQLVRVGHPARVLNSLVSQSLDVVTSTCNGGSIVRDIRSDIDKELSKVRKSRSARERKGIYDEIKILRKELRERERKVTSDVIVGAKVVLCTLHGAGSKHLEKASDCFVEGDKSRSLFDTIIIDEVSQSIEPQCWIPVIAFPNARRLVLAGDNMQLPPTLHSFSSSSSKDKKKFKDAEILSQSLFDRLVKIYKKERILRMLKVQYRMNKVIMEFPSNFMYDGELVAAESVSNHLLSDIEKIKDCEETTTPVIWIDTQGNDEYEECRGDYEDGVLNGSKMDFNSLQDSKWNMEEALLVCTQVEKLVYTMGVDPENIGVITPYSAQVSLIKRLLYNYKKKDLKSSTTNLDCDLNAIEVSTVDGFQGREKEAIIMSLVRSNEKGEVGFLSDSRRLNVAVTRPRRLLLIIGDMETLGKKSSNEKPTKADMLREGFLPEWVNWVTNQSEKDRGVLVDYPTPA